MVVLVIFVSEGGDGYKNECKQSSKVKRCGVVNVAVVVMVVMVLMVVVVIVVAVAVYTTDKLWY